MIIASGLFPEYPCSTAVVDEHHHHTTGRRYQQQHPQEQPCRGVPPPPPGSPARCPPPPLSVPTATTCSRNANILSCSDVNAQHCMNSCVAYGKICPYVARMACQYATNAVQGLKQDSTLFSSLVVQQQGDTNGEDGESDCFTRIPASDIRILEKLGEGGFSNVNRCMVKMKKKTVTTTTLLTTDTAADTAEADADTADVASVQEQQERAAPVVQETTIEQEFAIKYLRRKAMVDLHQFKHGAADLACEAYFLQVLHHPSIVQLHGISCCNNSNSNNSNNISNSSNNMVDSFAAAANHPRGTEQDTAEHSFYIVIDKLNDTLENKIHEWKCEKDKHQQLQYSNLMLLSRLTNPLFSQDCKERKRTQLLERVQIILSIANAMEYLHSLDVIFRDLKPDNIGFTANGQLKLFDFGLAKELKSSLKNNNNNNSSSSNETTTMDDTYNLTGNTGSRRYMAPEVALEKPYGKSVDVYSFGVLVWEVMCAEKPFFGYSSERHMQQVVLGGERPKMDAHHTSTWPSSTELVALVVQCWSTCPKSRPTFTEIIRVLNGILLPYCCSPAAAATATMTAAESSSSTATTASTTTTTTPGMLETSTLVIPLRPLYRRSSSSTSAAAGAATVITPPHTPKTMTSISSPLTALFRVTASPLKPLLRSQRSRSAGDHRHHSPGGGGKTTTTTTTTTVPLPPLPIPVGEQGSSSFAAMMPASLPATPSSNRRTKSWGFGLKR